MQRLTPKQEAFCQRYIETGNASEAYRLSYNAARMKPETVNRKAFDVLANGNIAARLDELRAHHMRRHEVTVDRIVSELAKIAFANAQDFFAWGPSGVTVKASDDLTEDQRAVVCEVSQTVTAEGGTIRVKLSDKQAALEKLGKHLGMFVDRSESKNTNVNYNISAEPLTEDEWERQYAGVGSAARAPASTH
jgi:phage terminase small subunit